MKKLALLMFYTICIITIPICIAKQSVKINEQNKVPSKPLNFAHELSFPSDILKSTESISIFLPPSFDEASDDHTYPIIFANDEHGQQFFHTLTGVVSHLSKLDRMPESIVVSLNSGGQIPEVHTHGLWGREKLDKYGDVTQYLRHLKQELIPYLQKHYRASSHSTIIGVSGSSLFPLYAFTHDIEMFDNYILLAAHDIIGMGFEPDKTMVEHLQAGLASKKISPTHLYFAVADSDANSEPRYIKNIQSLETALLPLMKNGLNSKIDIIPNERHYDAYIKTLLGAFEMFYPEKIWAPKYRDLIALTGNAMANIDAYYQQLSEVHDITLLPKADRWNSVNCLRWVSGQLQNEDRIQEAIEVATRWVKYRPNSAPAKQKLAELKQQLPNKQD
jgi:predicted alpha/beta superfamily hydrolase